MRCLQDAREGEDRVVWKERARWQLGACNSLQDAAAARREAAKRKAEKDAAEEVSRDTDDSSTGQSSDEEVADGKRQRKVGF